MGFPATTATSPVIEIKPAPQWQLKAGFSLSPDFLTPSWKAWKNWFPLHYTETDIRIQMGEKKKNIRYKKFLHTIKHRGKAARPPVGRARCGGPAPHIPRSTEFSSPRGLPPATADRPLRKRTPTPPPTCGSTPIAPWPIHLP